MSARRLIAGSSKGRGLLSSRLGRLSPLAAALAYPYLLAAYHDGVHSSGPDGWGLPIGIAALAGAFCVPAFALTIAVAIGRQSEMTRFDVRARRLAYLSLAAPPLFLLLGVGLGLLGSPIDEIAVWNVLWILAAIYGVLANDKSKANSARTAPRLRVFHGTTAALLTIFAIFHISNHLAGLLGPDTHARVMEMGRVVYRSGFVEPALITLLLVQLSSGARLALNWTSGSGDVHRAIQVGSGIYLGVFVLTHVNSALISARFVRDIPTDWAWASGAPVGLLADAWNIRLLPHYAFGVFFLLVHLCSGLRMVALAHRVERRLADRTWLAGAVVSGLVATSIIVALCGVRL